MCRGAIYLLVWLCSIPVLGQQGRGPDVSSRYPDSELINGPEYVPALVGRTTNPFFGSKDVQEGKLYFNHHAYQHVYLVYDIYTDQVVLRVKNPSGLYALVSLDQKRVEGFEIQGHRFNRITPPASGVFRTDNGFYEACYSGNSLSLVCKRVKVESRENSVVELQQDDHYFLTRNGKVTEVKGYRALQELVSSQKTLLRQFAKKNRIRPRRLRHEDILLLVQYCDELLRDPHAP